MTDQSRKRADKMSGQKHAACSDKVPPAKKRGVSVKMVQKWITESDREMSTSAWLKYKKADRDYMAMLKHAQLQPCVVVGSKNLRASSYKDHVATDMHKRAMLLLKKQSSSDVTEYALIATILMVTLR